MQKRMTLGMNGVLEIPVLIRFDRNGDCILQNAVGIPWEEVFL